MLIDNNVLTPQSSPHTSANIRFGIGKRQKQKENRGDVNTCVAKIRYVFDSTLHSKVLSGVKFQGLKVDFPSVFCDTGGLYSR